MENKLNPLDRLALRAIHKGPNWGPDMGPRWGRVVGWPLKRKRGANKLTSLEATDLGLAKKDVAAGLVRSACLGSYHGRNGRNAG